MEIIGFFFAAFSPTENVKFHCQCGQKLLGLWPYKKLYNIGRSEIQQGTEASFKF